MSHTRALIAAAAVVLLGMGGSPSAAAGPTVTAQPYPQWSPTSVTAAPGDTVTWTNNASAPGDHNVVIEDAQGQRVAGNTPSTTAWTFQHTFTQPGTYTFYCEVHSSVVNGTRQGMVGTLTVGGPAPSGGSTGGYGTGTSTGTGSGTGSGTGTGTATGAGSGPGPAATTPGASTTPAITGAPVSHKHRAKHHARHRHARHRPRHPRRPARHRAGGH